MNQLFFLFKTLLLTCLLLSCKKEGPITEPPLEPGGGHGNVLPMGQPVGELYTEFVGVDGGVVKSPDGRIEVNIPAGALTRETEIGIQPLKNTAKSGIGFSYRLTPHGTVFKKNVTITFSYKKDARRISSEKGLEVAYQNKKGEWMCLGNAVKDPVNKTISVKTDHFSDWAFLETLELSPVVKTVHVSERITLQALRNVSPGDEDYLAPLVDSAAATVQPTLIDPKYIVRWTLNGPGTLEAKGNQAFYTAPPTKPARNTATVTVELKIKGKQVLLISTIYIVDEGISLSVDDSPFKSYTGTATKTPDGIRFGFVNHRTANDMPQIICLWPKRGPKAEGFFSWSQLSDDDNHVSFKYVVPDFSRTYTSAFVNQGDEVEDSGGFIQVEELDENGKKFIAGIFVIENSGIIESATAEQSGIGNIIGTFKLLRTW